MGLAALWSGSRFYYCWMMEFWIVGLFLGIFKAVTFVYSCGKTVFFFHVGNSQTEYYMAIVSRVFLCSRLECFQLKYLTKSKAGYFYWRKIILLMMMMMMILNV